MGTPASLATSDGLIIKTVDLSKTYPEMDVPAVDRLCLEVLPGEIFGLLGPNGAGKTTTAGMLTTRVVPSSGQAIVGSVDVIRHPSLVKQLIGVVSQQNTLDRSLTVRENLYYHGLLFGLGTRKSRQISDELLEKFHLANWGDKSVFALSGGMAQRLMVARAIFHSPAVLFLDEPTAGLDPQSRLALWEILEDLNSKGQTILLTTHYMEEADQLCNRVAIMDHGKILALDSPENLKKSLGASAVLTVRLDGDKKGFADLLEREIDGVTNCREIQGGLEAHVASPEKLLPKVISKAEAGGYSVLDIGLKEATLETVFINLTGKDLRD